MSGNNLSLFGEMAIGNAQIKMRHDDVGVRVGALLWVVLALISLFYFLSGSGSEVGSLLSEKPMSFVFSQVMALVVGILVGMALTRRTRRKWEAKAEEDRAERATAKKAELDEFLATKDA